MASPLEASVLSSIPPLLCAVAVMTSIIGGGFLATRGAHLLSDDKEPPLTAVGSSMTSNVVCPQIVLVKAEDETPCMMIDHTEATVISRSDAVLVPLKMEESGATLLQCHPSSSWVWATQHDECPRPSYKGK
ncbi:hypothetical protein B0H14DRAFT_2621408 [Mycena olivaceomarginata]|nr:hypothetical protein B0H14DRAFT_2621408 [Mycena olivaceomarginata]